jgi:spore maturation protein CgeB
VTLQIYSRLEEIRQQVIDELERADVALMTSYCPDGTQAAELVLGSDACLKVFYDLDTPVTLDALNSGKRVTYLPEDGLAEFDLVLSYTGGRALDELRSRLGARRVVPFYGWVDPDVHCPMSPMDEFLADLGYLGTFAADRQMVLEELLVEPARGRPQARFVIGGAQYPETFPWSSNIFFVRHLPPLLHPSFFCSTRATLNVTRRAMADYGFCPSGRLFEAAACGAAILTDTWEGLEEFFVPGVEVLPVRNCSDVLAALNLSDRELQRIAAGARARTLKNYTAAVRACELESILDDVCLSERRQTVMAGE